MKKTKGEQINTHLLEDQEPEKPCGVRALWRGVITQALMDAGSNSAKAEHRKEKLKAIAWLTGDCESFELVCSMAGLEPDYVKKKALAAMKNGCKWRAAPARKKPISEKSKKIKERLVKQIPVYS